MDGPFKAGAIFDILPKAVLEIGAIGKERRNEQQKYSYRGIDDALDMIAPVLTRHGVTYSLDEKLLRHTSEIVERGGGKGSQIITRALVRVSIKLIAQDGSYTTLTATGEGMDYGGDKATSKATSAAYKYAMFLGLGVPYSQIEEQDAGNGPEVDPGSNQAPGRRERVTRDELSALKAKWLVANAANLPAGIDPFDSFLAHVASQYKVSDRSLREVGNWTRDLYNKVAENLQVSA